jgi:hypothetical protein
VKLGLFLCSIGFHRLHPAKITFSREHFEHTGQYLRQCKRCGCLLSLTEKRPAAAGVMGVDRG